jgi:lysophospholipase L1-like esterase
MNPGKLRNFLFIAAVLAALSLPTMFMARQPKPVPQASQPPAASANSSRQQGSQLTERDRKLLTDFGNLARFREADLKLGPPAPGQYRVVFMGDSITQGWDLEKSFPGKPYINRGISGQTSPQMLLRFRQDVINLKPKVVVILAGTNDIAQNTGPMPLSQTEGDIVSMAQLARANGIRVVICSVLPSVRFPWHPQVPNVASKIVKVNRWLKAYAAGHGYVYVDYYSAMKDPAGGLPSNLSHDGVHPLPAGYAIMAPLAETGIEEALK